MGPAVSRTTAVVAVAALLDVLVTPTSLLSVLRGVLEGLPALVELRALLVLLDPPVQVAAAAVVGAVAARQPSPDQLAVRAVRAALVLLAS